MEALVRPVVQAAGLEVWEVTYRKEGGRMVLRVAVDREGGVDVDTLSDVSGRISRRLDLESFTAGTYALEVTSPGLERTLRTPEHYRRSIGRTVRLTARIGQGSEVVEGSLIAADEAGATVATAAGERTVAYGAIASARTTFTWGTGARR
ncbi:MAG: ribosome maturation factor RimP [Actinomycetota bacterium]